MFSFSFGCEQVQELTRSIGYAHGLEDKQSHHAHCRRHYNATEDVKTTKAPKDDKGHQDIHAIGSYLAKDILTARWEKEIEDFLSIERENRKEVEEKQDQIDPDEFDKELGDEG